VGTKFVNWLFRSHFQGNCFGSVGDNQHVEGPTFREIVLVVWAIIKSHFQGNCFGSLGMLGVCRLYREEVPLSGKLFW
jgi:hypothetical protein